MQGPHTLRRHKFGENKDVKDTDGCPQGMGSRWPMGRGFGPAIARGLDMEIQRYYREHKQSDEMLRRKEEVRGTLERVIQERMASRDYTVCLFGSSVSGFGSRTSDADYTILTLGIRNKGFRGGQLRILENVLHHFKRAPFTGNSVPLGRFSLIKARVPLLHFKFWGRIEADLSVDSVDGVRNSTMLQAFAEFDKRVIPLVLIIKEWSKQCGINNARAGYLSSYSVVLMVIFFLQCKSSGCQITVCTLACERVIELWRL
jgi:DNA polymerase sigma